MFRMKVHGNCVRFILTNFRNQYISWSVRLPDNTDTDSDKKWTIKNCVQVFILLDTDTDTDTDAIGFQTHFVGVSIDVGVRQCEHTIRQFEKRA